MPFGKKYVQQYSFKEIKSCIRHRIKMPDGIYIQHPTFEILLVLCMFEKGCLGKSKLEKYLVQVDYQVV